MRGLDRGSIPISSPGSECAKQCFRSILDSPMFNYASHAGAGMADVT